MCISLPRANPSPNPVRTVRGLQRVCQHEEDLIRVHSGRREVCLCRRRTGRLQELDQLKYNVSKEDEPDSDEDSLVLTSNDVPQWDGAAADELVIKDITGL